MENVSKREGAINLIVNKWRLLVAATLLTGLTACGELPYNNISNEQLHAMLKQDVPIYDIRRAEEWLETGVVEGSELSTFVDADGRVIPGFLEEFTAQNKKDEPVILICRTGSRTRTLARYLSEELGYTQVYNVRNGITQWISHGHPVEKKGSRLN